MENISITVNRCLEYDVCVVGGGLGGASAAIAAARKGASVALIEETGILGGQGTMGIVTPISATHTRNGVSFGGLTKELTDKVISLSQKYCSFDQDQNEIWNNASPHILKYVLVNEAEKCGVDIKFHTALVSAEASFGSINSIIVHNRNGFDRISAKMFVDASGDAMLTYLSGAEYVKGSEDGVFDVLKQTGFDTINNF